MRQSDCEVEEEDVVNKQIKTLLFMGLVSSGCVGDRNSTDTTNECSHDVMETDLEVDVPVGPSVDPSSGKVVLGANQRVIVSSTYGAPQPGPNGAPFTERYQQVLVGIEQQLAGQPGLLALQLGNSNRCGAGRTLAIWRSEEEMYDFVTSRAHLDAMREANELLRPGYAVTHWKATKPEQLTMDEAVRQLAKVEASGE